MPRPARKHWTWDDYVKLPDDGKRYEVVDGELCVTPAPGVEHQDAVGALFLVLSSWANQRGNGVVLLSPVDVLLGSDTIVQPDLLWICGDRVREIVADQVRGIPDLVVEVLSPSTARRDRLKKSEVYARFGAREYWLVDPKDRSVEIRTPVGGAFAEHARGTGNTPLASAMDASLTAVPATLFRDFGTRR